MIKCVPTFDARIIHATFSTRYSMCSTMVRLQEYYESPFPQIRGKVFSLDKFMDIYAANQENGDFTYFTDWAGFNVPGNVINAFFEDYADCLRAKEVALLAEITRLAGNRGDDFYLIATKQDGNNSTIQHELAHANYYLDAAFRNDVVRLVSELPRDMTDKIIKRLGEMGYTPEVFNDEIQAYLSTSDDKYLKKLFGVTAKELKHEGVGALRASWYGRFHGIY